MRYDYKNLLQYQNLSNYYKAKPNPNSSYPLHIKIIQCQEKI
jgi:hypothetical protein